MKKLFLAVLFVLSLAGQSHAQWAMTAGEAIDLTPSGSMILIEVEDATTSNKGAASFNSTHFSVSSGAVTMQTEFLQDTAGAMATGNTETGITVTYQDSTGTTDYVTDVTASSTNTFTNKTIDGDDNTVQDLPYSAINSTARTGVDTRLVSGTIGVAGNCAEWNADGDLVDAGDPCGTGGGGGGDLDSDFTTYTIKAYRSDGDTVLVNDIEDNGAVKSITMDDLFDNVQITGTLGDLEDLDDVVIEDTEAEHLLILDDQGIWVNRFLTEDDLPDSYTAPLALVADALSVDVVLGDDTSGDYVNGATASGGLETAGATESVTLGLRTDCGANQVLKYVSSVWTCAADNSAGGSGFAPADLTAQYLMLSVNGTNLGERSIVPTSGNTNDGIITTDAGAGSTFTFAVDIKTAAENGVGSTTSASGLEFESEELTMLQGCADGEILKWEETTDTWDCAADTGGSATPGGSDTYVQYNDGGVFGGDSGFVYNETTNSATLLGDLTVAPDSYDATNWNGVQEAAPKDAVRDEIEAIYAAGIGTITCTGTVCHTTTLTNDISVGGTNSADAEVYLSRANATITAQNGLITGNGVDENHDIFTVNRASSDVTALWRETDEWVELPVSLNIIGSLYVNGDEFEGGGGGGGSGDVDGAASSVDSEIVLFSGTTGKVIKRATGSGIVKVTSGVYSAVTAPTGTIVGTSDTQTLTAKTMAVGSNSITGTANRCARFGSGGALEAYTADCADLVSETFSGYTEKSSPHADDTIVINDNEAAGVMKSVKISNLSTGGGGSSGCWELDGNDDLMPIAATCVDTLWEEDGNGDLQPLS